MDKKVEKTKLPYAESHFFSVRKVGLPQNYNCSYNASITQTSILRDGKEVASGVSSAIVRLNPVNESIHGSHFSCLGIQTDGSRRYENFTMVVTGKLSAQ